MVTYLFGSSSIKNTGNEFYSSNENYDHSDVEILRSKMGLKEDGKQSQRKSLRRRRTSPRGSEEISTREDKNGEGSVEGTDDCDSGNHI